MERNNEAAAERAVSSMLRIPFGLVALMSAAIIAATAASAAAAATTCTGGVFNGVAISGGLIVTGDCVYLNSAISGGVEVTSTGGLELENSAVSGGIVVSPGGELDVGHGLGTQIATGLPNSISGGITFNSGRDIDLINATVSGPTKIIGPTPPGVIPLVCGSTLDSVELTGVSNALVGDPGEPVEGGTPADCPGNIVSGGINVTNSSRVEIESNLVSGGISVSNSTLIEVAGNVVSGGITCSNVTASSDGDHTPNIGGPNSCP
jgi:hypothetical protein